MGGNILVDIYTAPIPEQEIGCVVCSLRQEQINETKSLKRKYQRYYVWKLLEYAAYHSLGLDAQELVFSKSANGKWHCDKFSFSLSHTQNAVAVAISTMPVGVDLECAARTVSPKLADTILTSSEHNQLSGIPPEQHARYLLEKWCAKESLFKAGDFSAFQPKKIETDTGVITQFLEIGSNTYCCAVAAENLSALRIFENIDL